MGSYTINKDDIISQVVINDYMEYVTLSNRRRCVYYKKTDKIPKKYQKKEFSFNKENILINTESKEKVIKNIRSAGKPKLKKISGQDIWSGINHNLRSNMALKIKEYFYTNLKSYIKPIDEKLYPIGIDMHFIKPLGVKNWDVDNLALIYRKTLLDTLKMILKVDDSAEFVREIPTKYTPSETDERKLIITIYTLNNDKS